MLILCFLLGGGGFSTGGGGSSYCIPAASSVIYTTGYQLGNGKIVVSFTDDPLFPTSQPSRQPTSMPS
jgi:hypothetical protein